MVQNVIKNIFAYYVRNNFHVGLAATALTLVSWHTQDVQPDAATLLFVFSSVFLSYGFVKNFGLGVEIYREKPFLFLLWCGAAAYFFYYFLEAGLETKILIISLVVLSALYALPSKWFPKNLRNTPGWKSFAVAVSWMGLCAGLGITEGELVADADFLKWMLQLLCLVWVWIIPFDIRDLQTDDADLHTLPQKWGVRTTQWVSTAVLFLVLVIAWSKACCLSADLLLTVVITLFLLWISSNKKSEYFASFWVESIPIFWFITLWVMEWIR